MWDVKTISGKEVSKCGRRESNSGVLPEKVMSKIVSYFPTLPKSPCKASVGWR